jgi:hypothetical protein
MHALATLALSLLIAAPAFAQSVTPVPRPGRHPHPDSSVGGAPFACGSPSDDDLMHHPGTVALLWSLLGAPRLVCNTRDHLVGAGAKGGTQRANETQKQVGHRAMLHDGEAAWPGTLAVEVTVGKQGSRMTTWRTTGGRSTSWSCPRANTRPRSPGTASAPSASTKAPGSCASCRPSGGRGPVESGDLAPALSATATSWPSSCRLGPAPPRPSSSAGRTAWAAW